MRITKDDIPARIDAPGAVARQAIDFGAVSSDATMGAEYFSFGAGVDLAPLFEGLHDDLCQVPHWGYVVSGGLVVTYADGHEEPCSGDDLFYWPPGHSVRAVEDTDVVLFSPQVEHGAVLDHVLARMAG